MRTEKKNQFLKNTFRSLKSFVTSHKYLSMRPHAIEFLHAFQPRVNIHFHKASLILHFKGILQLNEHTIVTDSMFLSVSQYFYFFTRAQAVGRRHVS